MTNVSFYKSIRDCQFETNTQRELLLWKAYDIVILESRPDKAKLQAYVEVAPIASDKNGAKSLARGYHSMLKENARNGYTIVY